MFSDPDCDKMRGYVFNRTGSLMTKREALPDYSPWRVSICDLGATLPASNDLTRNDINDTIYTILCDDLEFDAEDVENASR